MSHAVNTISLLKTSLILLFVFFFAATEAKSDPNKKLTFTVKTNIESKLKYKILLSSVKDDTLCRHSKGDRRAEVTPYLPSHQRFNFERSNEKFNALFEWHLCLKVKGKVYRGWRGFDPGPQAEMHVACFIDSKQIKARNREKYLCQTEGVTPNIENHHDFARLCGVESGGQCLSFENEETYLFWKSIKNKKSFTEMLYEKILLHAKQEAEESPILFLDINHQEPSAVFVQRQAKSGIQIKHVDQWSNGEGTKVSVFIEDVVSANEVRVHVSYYSGKLASGHMTYVMKKVAGAWKVSRQIFGPIA